MIRKVRVENYKSIPDLTLDLGRVTVLIGANGSGKSNILEAIALASAAAQNKLDNEFLVSRGIRVTETRFMRSAFDKGYTPPEPQDLAIENGNETPNKNAHSHCESIKVWIHGDDEVEFDCELVADEKASYPKWAQTPNSLVRQFFGREFLARIEAEKLEPGTPATPEILERLVSHYNQIEKIILSQQESGKLPGFSGTLRGFLVYAPENSSLRTFQAEGQILPLGIRGEGLFAHLKELNSGAHQQRLVRIQEKLGLIDWFDNFVIPEDLSLGERSIRIRDRFLPDRALFDQRSANEGFLFLLFYLTLFISPDTPAFFSIDNIDSSLNPKLCIALLQQLVLLAKEYDKQVILTTHNPAVLDGLNLQDDEQRLLVVDRNKDGYTRVRRVDPPKPSAGQIPVSLSEAFMRGYIGGLPKNF
ncbi:MAG TPA: AAA family ATPase [Gemmataceae bacterium]|jgi:energy-coupling factor transporter ATP-binding protein EcfA2|nr:AAA family ATPase [Gemmataceae bacterium]